MKAEFIAPTATELAEIKQGKLETINRLYLANYPFIVCICKSYCRGARVFDFVEDMAQECYLYFSGFEFSRVSAFIRNIKDVCLYVRWGGERVFHQVRQGKTEILTILDEPLTRNAKHTDGNSTFGESIASPVDILDEIEPPTDYAEKVHDIALKYLTPRQREAFEYFYYTDLTAREVGQAMGVNINGAQSLKTAYLKCLRKHADEFRNELLLNGLDSLYIATAL